MICTISTLFYLQYFFGFSASLPYDAPNKEREIHQIELVNKTTKRFFELDMLLVPRNESKKWPNQTVAYVFDEVYPISEEIKNLSMVAMTTISNYSCILFKMRDHEDHYLNITAKSSGCFAYLGYVRSGGQELNLAPNCNTLEVVVHEIMHALGFFHEHNRPDRDEFVVVNYTNILNGAESSFEKMTNLTVEHDDTMQQNISYDKQSIMHYQRFAFTKHDIKEEYRDMMTIYSIDDYQEILGNSGGLSDKDVVRLNRYYSCDVDIQHLVNLKNGIALSLKTTISTGPIRTGPGKNGRTSTIAGNGESTRTTVAGSEGAVNTTLAGSEGAAKTTVAGSVGAANTTLAGSEGAAKTTVGAANTTVAGSEGAANTTVAGSGEAARTTEAGSGESAKTTVAGNTGASNNTVRASLTTVSTSDVSVTKSSATGNNQTTLVATTQTINETSNQSNGTKTNNWGENSNANNIRSNLCTIFSFFMYLAIIALVL